MARTSATCSSHRMRSSSSCRRAIHTRKTHIQRALIAKQLIVLRIDYSDVPDDMPLPPIIVMWHAHACWHPSFVLCMCGIHFLLAGNEGGCVLSQQWRAFHSRLDIIARPRASHPTASMGRLSAAYELQACGANRAVLGWRLSDAPKPVLTVRSARRSQPT